ncbi:MAG: response regulator [Deltaproteobacteria bacterium]|nr:response regulator [Deltaproteobacteria bacterium]MBN2670183.1 response regulator [Deltaproteobacteria bacterium]
MIRKELSRQAVGNRWGDFFRAAVVGSWAAYLMISEFSDVNRWVPISIYALLCIGIIGIRRLISNMVVFALLSMTIDVVLLSYLIHYFGSHSSQVAVFYVLVLMGYHLVEPKIVRRISLAACILGYATVLILERFELISFFTDAHQAAVLPAMERTVSAFLKIASALVGCYAMLSISSKKIEAYVTNEKRLLDEKREAQKESRSLQKQIEASQRLESLGRLAGGVAHDFNNLLTGILSYTQFLKEDLHHDTESHRDVDAILNATQKASKLTAQLLTFGRKQIIRPHIISLNAVVADTREILRRSIGENIQVVSETSSDLGNIKADSSQIEQVIMNLVVNAKDAMPNGGVLTIRTENLDITAENFKKFPELSLGPHVVISVADTGNGILPEHLDKIFDPFFTTKRKGEGTGLGLSTVYGIIRQNSGHIDVISTPGSGSTFRCVFPRVFENISVKTAPQPIVSGTRQTILVAEDEDLVRASVTRILTRQNYRVLVADSGEEALEIFRNCNGCVDLLLTDVIMTGITGETLANELQKNNPTLPVLFMSGYTEDAIVNKGILKEGTSFLAKPFSAEQLLMAVAKTLKRAKKAASE